MFHRGLFFLILISLLFNLSYSQLNCTQITNGTCTKCPIGSRPFLLKCYPLIDNCILYDGIDCSKCNVGFEIKTSSALQTNILTQKTSISNKICSKILSKQEYSDDNIDIANPGDAED